jgi:hypothetical protein
MIHGTHSEVVNRLKRSEGHIGTIIEMIEAKRDASMLRSSSTQSRRQSKTPRKSTSTITSTIALRI